jgi:methyl-accepting chemotaxis protein
MNIYHKIVLISALGGIAGSALALAVFIATGAWIGVSLALLGGAAAGGLGVWLAARAILQQVGTQLDALAKAPRDVPPLAAEPTGWIELDRHLEAVRQTIERYRRSEADFDEVERLARSLWRAVADLPAGVEVGADGRGGVLSLLDEVRQTADKVFENAHALDQATEQIASGAWDQSETVARTTTTVEALSDKIDKISHNAEAAAEAGQRARQEARRGLEQVQGLIEGIDRLRAHIESNGRKVRRLGDRSVEIGTIVDLIDGISGRTDMLALNATIESVRAGEHGRGFAVVAEEIRKLAERTAAATREIGTLVEAIQADTHESIAALGQEQAEVEQEARRVREAGAALERIGEVAERSAKLVEGISHSANDQVESTHELVRAMQRISEVTQQTLAGSARAREHVRLLTQRCDRMHRLSSVEAVSRAPAPVNGAGSTAARHRPTNGSQHRRSLPAEQPR